MAFARRRETRLLLWVVILIASLVICGAVGEACDLSDRCGDARLRFLVAGSAITAFIAIVMIALHLFNMWKLLKLEFFIAVLVLGAFAALCAVVVSPRTLRDIYSTGIDAIPINLGPIADPIELPAFTPLGRIAINLLVNSLLAAAWVGFAAALLLSGMALLHRGWKLKQHKDDIAQDAHHNKLRSYRDSEETVDTADDPEAPHAIGGVGVGSAESPTYVASTTTRETTTTIPT